MCARAFPIYCTGDEIKIHFDGWGPEYDYMVFQRSDRTLNPYL